MGILISKLVTWYFANLHSHLMHVLLLLLLLLLLLVLVLLLLLLLVLMILNGLTRLHLVVHRLAVGDLKYF